MAAPGNAQIKPDQMAQTGESPKVRTLHEPPDIWELVHETRVEFKPGSAFVSRFKALNPLAIAVILLIIGGGAVFGFMKLRDRSENHTAAPSVPAESNKPKIVLNPQSTESNRTATVPAHTAPASTLPEPKKIEEPKTAVTVTAAPPASEAPAKPRRDPTTAITPKGTTVAAPRPKDKARPTSATKTAGATVTRGDTKTGNLGLNTVTPKSDKEKVTDSTAAKKPADKSPSPQLIAPPKTSPTPKPKVIAWP